MRQPDMSMWHGRDDTVSEGPLAVRWHQAVRPLSDDSAPGYALLGFPCDEGVKRNSGRPGASHAPPAIRKLLGSLAWHINEPFYDAGDMSINDMILEDAQNHLSDTVSALIKQNHLPLVLGGGHETAWGVFQGIKAAHEGKILGIINLDAHFDLRRSTQAHSGTPFAQMADWSKKHQSPFRYLCLGIADESNTRTLFQCAEHLGVTWLTDLQLARMNCDELKLHIQPFMDSADQLYLSIDLDVLPNWVMPAVSAPNGVGISLTILFDIIRHIARSGKVIAADIVEFNPAYDHNQCGARTTARIAAHLIKHWQRPS